MNFSPKRAGEVEIFTVDFVNLLPAGVTITSAPWSNVVWSGTDASAASMIQGSASISGTKVSSKIGGGVAGVTYAPFCTAVTSDGETLVLPVYGDGLLEITP